MSTVTYDLEVILQQAIDNLPDKVHLYIVDRDASLSNRQCADILEGDTNAALDCINDNLEPDKETGTNHSPASPKEPQYICNQCAKKTGGTWPTGHLATWHRGQCDVCGKLQVLANVGDWDWPDKQPRGMRD